MPFEPPDPPPPGDLEDDHDDGVDYVGISRISGPQRPVYPRLGTLKRPERQATTVTMWTKLRRRAA